MPRTTLLVGSRDRIWILPARHCLYYVLAVLWWVKGLLSWGVSASSFVKWGAGQEWGKGDLYTWHLCTCLEAQQEPNCVRWIRLSLRGSLPTTSIFVRRNAVILTTALQHLPLPPKAKSRSPMEDRCPQRPGTVVDSESFPPWAPRHGWEWLIGLGSRTWYPSDSKIGKEINWSLNLKKKKNSLQVA